MEQIRGVDWTSDLTNSTEKQFFKSLENTNKSLNLIGYSMGGRYLLRNLTHLPDCVQSIILLAPRIYLPSKNRMKQIEFERITLENLKHLDQDSFLNYWNRLPIFEHDPPKPIGTQWRPDYWSRVFELMRPSQQMDHREQIAKNSKVHLVCGSLDTKYCEHYDQLETLNPIRKLPDLGHRLNKRLVVEKICENLT